MGCPYGSYKRETEKELALIDDKQREFVCDYFKESYDVLNITIQKIKKSSYIEQKQETFTGILKEERNDLKWIDFY